MNATPTTTPPLRGLPLGAREESPEVSATARGERFEIHDERTASWYLQKLRRIDQDRDAIKAAAAERIAQLDADENKLRGLFDSQLQTWARAEGEKRRRRTVTLPLAGASVVLRTVPASVQLGNRPEDRQAAADVAQTLGMVKTPAPDLSAYRKHAAEWLKTTGELLPGVVQTEERESFSIKYGTAGSEDDGQGEE